MSNWKDVVGYEGLYAVSDKGEIWGYYRDKLRKLSQRKNKKNNTLQINLIKEGKITTFLIHRLVAQAFIKKDLSTCEFVTHKNHNPRDNQLSNLIILKERNSVGGRIKRPDERVVGVKPVKQKKGLRFKSYFYTRLNKQVYVGTFDGEEKARAVAEKSMENYYMEKKA